MDRFDIFHKCCLVARHGALHSSPFVRDPTQTPRILDIGTGTGIWVIDMADKYINAEVVGVDVAMIQPAMIPLNSIFTQMNFEEEWHGLGTGSWDLIHLRMLCGSVTNWPNLYEKAFRHLKPGSGWLEHVEIDFSVHCDDGTLPTGSILDMWTQSLLDATKDSKPLAYNANTRVLLEQQGFEDINEEIIRVPLNPWPKDPWQKDIGRWYNLTLTQGLEALTLGPLSLLRNLKHVEVQA
ncbi:S-adenosyl-L-methionine-dependent methyltransferase [Acephala macrosclerotiorum]|nr:S-adenosyl-L-methionine-dependent methyltransferase [Acephala macrosclerotiorum]